MSKVGAALGPSILDMTGCNPNSRLPNSQYRSLKGLKEYLILISSTQYDSTMNKPLNKVNLTNNENDVIDVNGIANTEIRQCILC